VWCVGLPGGAYRHRLITPSIPEPGTDESILRVPLYERKGGGAGYSHFTDERADYY